MQQAEYNPTYREYLNALGCDYSKVKDETSIPFLPIELFKRRIVKTGDWTETHIFKSSGTTSAHRSRHFVRSMNDYLQGTIELFESNYGSLADHVILSLLPGYAPDSSLVSMVSQFIELSNKELSGFFPDESFFLDLYSRLKTCKSSNRKTILFGVTFSLLNFASKYNIDFPNLIIIETGGMKGKGEDLTRDEVHGHLIKSFGVSSIHSEYGMTELFSQAYSSGNGIFHPNETLMVLPGDLHDPLANGFTGVNSRLNIIDLNNVDTCAFIATSDIGKVYHDGSFEVLGRMDNADLRGCNLLYSG